MSIVKWKPNLLPNVDRFFDDFFKAEFPTWSRRNFSADGSTLPAVNVQETEDEFKLEVAAPGMSKIDFNVSVDNGVMTISAEKEMKNENNENGYSRKEFSYQSFQRSFSLPESVDDGQIKAKYNDGILYLTIPKRPEAKPKPAKMIKVS